jgi:hypothetical protein
MRKSCVLKKVLWRPLLAGLRITGCAIIDTVTLENNRGSIEEHAVNKQTLSGFTAAK